MEVLISIITPCFNNARNIGDTIKSVLCQSYKNWELICVDDGSCDNTCEIITDYSRKDSRIMLVKRIRTPKGGSVCRNIGIENSRGDYLIFLDADDKLDKDCLKNRLEKISSTDLDFVVFPNAILVDGVEGKITSDSKIKKHFLAYSSNHAVWQTTCPLYRKSFVEKVGGFDETYPRLQDVEFGIRCLAQTGNNYKAYLKDTPADCFYRISPNAKVFTKKYDLAYSTIPKLIELILDLNRKGKYKKSELSKVLICIILSIIMISAATSHKNGYKKIMPVGYQAFLNKTDRLLLCIVDSFGIYKPAYYKVAHIARYILLRLYY